MLWNKPSEEQLNKYSKGSKICDLISIKKRRTNKDLNESFFVPKKPFFFEDVTNLSNEHMTLKDNMFINMIKAEKEISNLRQEKKCML